MGRTLQRRLGEDQWTLLPSLQPTMVDAHRNDGSIDFLAEQIERRRRTRGQVPLFVLGAGISAGAVPFLKDVGEWFRDQPGLGERLRALAKQLADGNADRGQASELFAALQSKECRDIWRRFSRCFLLGHQPKIKCDGRPFNGLVNAKPTEAHYRLAELTLQGKATVISLNFDGLTLAALREQGRKMNPEGLAAALHTAEQVRRHYCSPDQVVISTVIKVRGDVFYATCDCESCPEARQEHPLDRLPKTDDLRCPACAGDTLSLQFAFPGLRVKEEAAYAVLSEALRFLEPRISALVIVGLSGLWDRYLLDVLFALAAHRRLLLADVKPAADKNQAIEQFRALYYPRFPVVSPDSPNTDASGFLRVAHDANTFFNLLSLKVGRT